MVVTLEQEQQKKYLKNKNMKKVKDLLSKLLEFTTGLGFYGIGLLGAAAVLYFFFGWSHLCSGLVGAFIFKNYNSIVNHIKKIIK